MQGDLNFSCAEYTDFIENISSGVKLGLVLDHAMLFEAIDLEEEEVCLFLDCNYISDHEDRIHILILSENMK
jgi:hypothetical protein